MDTVLTTRQNDIVNAAIDLIGENGVHGLTIKLLAQHVGVTEPALYRHFKGKQDILLAVLIRFEENTREIFQIVSNTGKTGIEQIIEVFAHNLKTFSKRPSVAAIIFSEESFKDDARLAEQVLKIMNTTEGFIMQVIESSDKGEFRKDIPKKELALILMGSLRLIVTRWRLSDYGFNLESEGKKLCDSLKLLVTAHN